MVAMTQVKNHGEGLSAGNGDAETFPFGIEGFPVEESTMNHDLAPLHGDHLAFQRYHFFQGEHVPEVNVEVPHHDGIAGGPGSQAQGFVHYRGNGTAVGVTGGASCLGTEPEPGVQMSVFIPVVANPEAIPLRISGDKAE